MDLFSWMVSVFSGFYGNNLWNLLNELGGLERFEIDENNDVVCGVFVIY